MPNSQQVSSTIFLEEEQKLVTTPILSEYHSEAHIIYENEVKLKNCRPHAVSWLSFYITAPLFLICFLL